MEQGAHGRDGSDIWSGALVDEATGGQMLGLLAAVAVDLLSSRPGVSIIANGRRRTLCARPALVDALDVVQIDHGGPSIDAMALGTAQSVLLSEHHTNWVELEQQSREAGYTSIHAFPIQGQARTLGALSLYSASPGLPAADLHIANGIARAAAAVIVRTGGLRPEHLHRSDQHRSDQHRSDEHRSDERRRVSELGATLDLIGAGPDDLFIRYFAIGGTQTRSDVESIMDGRRDVSTHELDTIDLAVDELVHEHHEARRPDTSRDR